VPAFSFLDFLILISHFSLAVNPYPKNTPSNSLQFPSRCTILVLLQLSFMPIQEQKTERQVTVGVYTMPYEADLVWSLLEAFEITVFPAGYYTIYIDWLYSNALGCIKLRVSEKDAADAREVIAGALAEGEKFKPTYSEGSCPHCGNGETAPAVRGREWAVLTWLVLGVPLGWPWTRLRCSSCGHTWKE
jgi:hypothetical protein